MLTNLTLKIFNEAIKSGSALVVWGTDWSAPSHALENRLRKLPLTVKLYGVNVDQELDLVVRYGIRGIPTLTLFKNGQLIAQETTLTPILQEQILNASIKNL